ncbi:NAD(P)-dependent dehydrogenase, short-chain alcohol dehydrogenase family [Cognatiyoonia koreensis]|uniref:NAD(P)-dependent dehydrogenase, short-chain alcohol dehydrogenase family n=1 Tax=Cognatiyoonia koreensis TaxID=364200 RepID=A0A1I0MQ78_9RHOB|nr:SDR family NAD(P)-dependent oxidoreductase [Cognatiyoonia koreensis]SEV90719.1 NAD(P)-dependent dehydrogenase, short-chain alcohol dehydrogenase family [Cognatiyoonia koreensis]
MTYLITGANRGIGAEMRTQLQSRGDTVIGTHRDAPQDGFLQLDVTQPADFDKLAQGLQGHKIATLVCNAGVYLDKGEDLETGYPQDMWAATFAANVTGVFKTIQTVLPFLESGSKIGIISSQMGANAKASGGSYIYRASKAAVLNLGSNLATDLKSRGISVGIYHPGWVQTDMGGDVAAITPTQSANGLIARLDDLSIQTSGTFQNWDGTPHPY